MKKKKQEGKEVKDTPVCVCVCACEQQKQARLYLLEEEEAAEQNHGIILMASF